MYFYIMQQSPIGKISQKKTELKQVIPCREDTKENNYRTKNAVHGSYINKNLRKDKSSIDIS